MKGRNSCFYPQKACDTNSGGLFFFFPWCLVACLCISEPGVEWLRGLRKPRKSLMSERIISVYESSSDFPQIPFHSGKKWIFSAREEKKTFNATWQAKHPVCSERFEHTLRIELMPYVLPALSCSLSTNSGNLLWLYCTEEVTREPFMQSCRVTSALYVEEINQFLWLTIGSGAVS